ncbi:MAG: flagellar FlbD family protein [Sedimentisphaerales bacterium]|nr:flagellar FlbD family protein [Sedimentisphaerales bacterium]
MIAATRLNGKRFVVNAEQIRYVESTPDTMITLMNGDKIMVKETLEEIVSLAVQYQRQIRVFQT